jgi:hypothetical protein
MLKDNYRLLKKRFPETLEALEKDNNSNQENIYVVEETRNNMETIKFNIDDKGFYLHSRYNPENEAKVLIDKYKDEIEEDSHVIFIGIGLGYHIKEFSESYSEAKISIYEPFEEILEEAMSRINLTHLKSNHLKIISTGNEYKKLIEAVSSGYTNSTVFIELPSYKNHLSKYYENFLKELKEGIHSTRRSIHTNLSFQKRWIVNSFANFSQVINTPNILMQDEDMFKDKTAIVVAAGPSLNDEIENLRFIKENKKAYIFSVGSAINTLLENDILPHAMNTYDPTANNSKVFDKIVEKGILEVPMIFGSSVGFETLKKYRGPKYHMITNQDYLSNYLLKMKDDRDISLVRDAASIAVVTIELLYKLKFKNIIMVGQNLGFIGEKEYADGISYYEKRNKSKSEEQKKNYIEVEDVYGKKIYTNETFNTMRKQIESYIESMNSCRFINTTKGGANIKGAEFKKLSKLINDELENGLYPGIKDNIKDTCYDLEFSKSKAEKLKDELILFNNEVDSLKKIAEDLVKALEDNNLKKFNKIYLEFDKIFNNISNNLIYKIISLPTNRVNINILSKRSNNSKTIKNQRKRAKEVLEIITQMYQVLKIDSIKLNYKGLVEMVNHNLDNKI